MMSNTTISKLFNPPMPCEGGQRHYWQHLSGSSLGLALCQAIQQHTGIRVVICPDSLTASRLEFELRFYSSAIHLNILPFPDWETLPYDSFSPHQDILSQRLATLNTLAHAENAVLIVPVSTLAYYICPKHYLLQNSLVLNVGQLFNINQMRLQLEQAGYHCVNQVYEHGEFAVRGSICDIFPMGSNKPFRIDLFDNEIDTIRTFDPDTQRSHDKIEAIHLLPAHEFPITPDAIADFKQRWRAHFEGDPLRSSIYQDISKGIISAGIEYYLPLFFDQAATLFDYLPENSLLIHVENTYNSLNHFWNEVNERYEQFRHDIERPILKPTELFITTERLFGLCKPFRQIYAQSTMDEKQGGNIFRFSCEHLPDITINPKSEQPLIKLQQFLEADTQRILFCAETPGRREMLLEQLSKINLIPKLFETWHDFINDAAKLGIIIAPLEQGFSLPESHLSVIAEGDIMGVRMIQQRRRRQRYGDASTDAIIKNLTELHSGAPVVHIEYGIGRYLGLKTINVGEYDAEFLTLEFADNAKIYVPVNSLHLITRYSGADVEHAPLTKLGTGQWERARKKAAEKVRDVAAELLNVYARRAARSGYTFPKPDKEYHAFCNGFPFEETPDQQQAIDHVIADMTSPKAMDRLVCGDVGFGKTEVAMRAAFLCVAAGKQVVILVPTTLLAQQHLESFKNRFADWPVTVELLSRFRSAKSQTEVIKHLGEGKVDIVIGTHKLLNESIAFKQLGLLIIDEEHRFGVKQKERLKAFRAEVDILTLTATPIPRTLNMALSGMRDLSIISTPPQRRLSIKTFVREYNKSIVRESMLRELMRGGQIFYLHNDVATINATADKIRELVPEARVAVGHGQMAERALEQIMSDFYHHRFNILVCTTIIETGIDIPTANTILIDRADKFGLAQLHQLRGRVGRSHHQAYAYLFTPPPKAMSRDAVKRLDAIASLEDLGAGFTLATHDLEIRGAGEILGEGQSGNIQSVGFTLYIDMLERAVEALKNGKEPDIDITLDKTVEIDLKIPTLIPENYMADVHGRLVLYKRIANAKTDDELKEIQVEMIDRFGILPEPVINLFKTTEIRLTAQQLGITKIEAGEQGGRIEFSDKTNIQPLKIIQLIQQKPQIYKLEGANKLRFNMGMCTAQQRIVGVQNLLAELAQK